MNPFVIVARPKQLYTELWVAQQWWLFVPLGYACTPDGEPWTFGDRYTAEAFCACFNSL